MLFHTLTLFICHVLVLLLVLPFVLFAYCLLYPLLLYTFYNVSKSVQPKKEIEEQKYDYQCNTCLRWKKVNDMGIRSTGRIYLHCKRCREVRDKASSKRKEQMEAQAKEQEHDKWIRLMCKIALTLCIRDITYYPAYRIILYFLQWMFTYFFHSHEQHSDRPSPNQQSTSCTSIRSHKLLELWGHAGKWAANSHEPAQSKVSFHSLAVPVGHPPMVLQPAMVAAAPASPPQLVPR